MSEEIKWENTMTGALERAKKENKLVLIDFYSPS
jgi:hypothetical protein